MHGDFCAVCAINYNDLEDLNYLEYYLRLDSIPLGHNPSLFKQEVRIQTKRGGKATIR